MQLSVPDALMCIGVLFMLVRHLWHDATRWLLHPETSASADLCMELHTGLAGWVICTSMPSPHKQGRLTMMVTGHCSSSAEAEAGMKGAAPAAACRSGALSWPASTAISIRRACASMMRPTSAAFRSRSTLISSLKRACIKARRTTRSEACV